MDRLNQFKQRLVEEVGLTNRNSKSKLGKRNDELDWLMHSTSNLNGPYEVTMLVSLNSNHEERNLIDIEQESRKSSKNLSNQQKEKKSIAQSALQVTRYIGMAAHLTSSSCSSPFAPMINTNSSHRMF